MSETERTTETAGAPAANAPAGPAAAPATPFHDLDAYLALRRQGAIALSPDGSRLVAVATELDRKKTGFSSALWEVDPSGEQPARRLTRSAPGESGPAFLPDGSLLFVSKRLDTETDDAPGEETKQSLWLLPRSGGESRLIARRDGGISGVRVAAESGTVVVTAPVMIGADAGEPDAAKRKRRKDNKVVAILHNGYPVRYWDYDLGPEQDRYFAATAPEASAGVAPGETAGESAAAVNAAPNAPATDTSAEGPSADPDAALELRDLTPDAGRALSEPSADLSRDGTFLISSWQRIDGHVDLAGDLVRIDIATGTRTVLASQPRSAYGDPAISPDGSQVACVRWQEGTHDEPEIQTLWLIPTGGSGEPRELPLDGDLHPTSLAWSPDCSTLYFVADEAGRAPVFALDVATGARRRLAADGAYSCLQVHPDGSTLIAVRSSYTDPGSVVALSAKVVDQQPRVLRGPAALPELPGTLTEVTAVAADGTPLRAFLALPAGASADNPAPLLLWVHGGPVSSWNAWSWRWCPWLMVARGYAVLLPDPALSTGYGREMIRRGWGAWGAKPFTDLMTMTDAALQRDDLDATRTAAMGGSFGGYMANWIAGHTDRFDAIVTHASLWALDQFGATTDAPNFWRHEMTPERAAANSPSASIGNISTPMLVIHGDKDYRVPIGEGLRLWWDLLAAQPAEEPLPHRFLYFPNENHWVLSPQHAKIWYQTVDAFLAWHVLGREFMAPELL